MASYFDKIKKKQEEEEASALKAPFTYFGTTINNKRQTENDSFINRSIEAIKRADDMAKLGKQGIYQSKEDVSKTGGALQGGYLRTYAEDEAAQRKEIAPMLSMEELRKNYGQSINNFGAVQKFYSQFKDKPDYFKRGSPSIDSFLEKEDKTPEQKRTNTPIEQRDATQVFKDTLDPTGIQTGTQRSKDPIPPAAQSYTARNLAVKPPSASQYLLNPHAKRLEQEKFFKETKHDTEAVRFAKHTGKYYDMTALDRVNFELASIENEPKYTQKKYDELIKEQDTLISEAWANTDTSKDNDYRQRIMGFETKLQELENRPAVLASKKHEAETVKNMIEVAQRYKPYTKAKDFEKTSQYQADALADAPSVATRAGAEYYEMRDVYKYLNASGDEQTKMINAANTGSANYVNPYDLNGVDQMAGEEIKIFNYLAVKEPDKAIQYLKDKSPELLLRRSIEKQELTEEVANEHGVGALLLSFGMQVQKSLMGPTQMVAGVMGADTNNPIFDINKNIKTLRGVSKEKLKTTLGKFGETKIPLIDVSIADFTFDAIASGVDSAVSMGLGALLGGGSLRMGEGMAQQALSTARWSRVGSLGLMGSRVAGDTMLDARERGIEPWKAGVLGISAGVIETLTELYSIEALFSPVNAKPWHYLAQNLIAEGSEEGVGAIANRIVDQFVAADQSIINQSAVEMSRATGIDMADALKIARTDWLKEFGAEVLSGAITGGAFAIPGMVMDVKSTRDIGKQTIKNSTLQGVVDLALESATKGGEAAVMAQNMPESPTINQRGKLVRVLTEDLQSQLDKAQTIEEARFIVDKTNALLSMVSEPVEKTTPVERADVERDERSQIKAQGEAEMKALLDRQAKEAQAFENAERDILEADRGGVTAGIVEAENIAKQALADIEQDKAAMLERHAKERQAVETAKENAQRERAEQETHRLTKNLPEAVVKDMDTVTDKETYRVAYELGRYGMPENAIMQVKGFDKLGEENAQKAYNFGKDEHVRSLTDALKVVPMKPGQGKVTYEKSVNINTLTQEQKNQIPFVEAFSKTMGYNVHIYASKANAEGIFTAPNGSFDPTTGTISVDINAGRKNETVGNVTMALTMGHELTHYLKESVPELFHEYSGKVLQYLNENGQDIRELIDSKLERARTQEIDLGDAVEEMIADASQMMLKDSTAIERLKQDSPGLYNKIKDWLKGFLDKVKSAFTGLDSTQAESKALYDGGYVNDLQQLYDNMLVVDAQKRDTVENRQQDMSNFGSPDEARATETNNKGDLKFSLRETVEETKDLIAVHNLRQQELISSFELGGFPMPSIAVMKPEHGHNRYGDVSIIFGRGSIDPAIDSKNKIYGGDAYTPTFPEVQYEIGYDETKGIRKKVKEIVGDELYRMLNSPFDEDNLQQEANRNRGDFGEAFQRHPLLIAAYLKSIGEQANIVKSIPTFSNSFDNETVDLIDKKIGDRLVDAGMGGYDDLMALEPEVRNAINDDWNEKHVTADTPEWRKILFKDPFPYSKMDGLVDGIVKKRNWDGETKVDRYETERELVNQISGDTEKAAYKSWVNDLLGGVIVNTGIRNNKDIFTPSGNRRSFDATHWQYTLENIVRAMRMDNKKGADMWANSNLFGVATKDYQSIEDAKKDKNRLTKIDDETYTAKKEAFQDRLIALASEIKSNRESNQFMALDRAAEALTDAARKVTTKGMQRALDGMRDYLNIQDDTAKKLFKLVSDISRMPTEYFEAKPERVVSTNEIKAIILPDTADKKLVEMLDKRGIQHIGYKAGDDASRLAALNSDAISGLKFSERERAPEMYSNMTEQISGIKGLKIGADSVISYLRKKGVKADEIKWSGIQTFLQGKKSVTKQDLIDFAKANELRVETVELDAKGGYTEEEITTFETEEEYFPSREELDETKFKQYTLDGGNNYQENLYILPDVDGTFQSQHWDEKNVIAHVRSQDFETTTGDNVFFIEEVQSDWHEKGREQGYVDGKVTEAEERLEEFYRIHGDKLEEGLGKAKVAYDEYYKDNDWNLDAPDLVDFVPKEYSAIFEERNRLVEAIPEQEKKIPQAPFADTWHEFALKRALRMAAEGDYEYMGWTTGQMQADRYNLAEQVSSIDAVKISDDSTQRYVSVFGKDGNIIKSLPESYTPTEVVATFGKDLGNRIIEGTEQGKKFIIKGDGLTIGGEGMKNFYDLGGKSSQNIPRFLNKYGAQWGAKISTIEMQGDGQTYSVPAIQITDSMKESVLYQGQTMYSERDSTGKDLTQEQAEYFKDSKVRDEQGRLLKVYHGTTNNFTVFDEAYKGYSTKSSDAFLGNFFTSDKDFSKFFTAQHSINWVTGEKEAKSSYTSHIKDGYVDIQRPLVIYKMSQEDALIIAREIMQGRSDADIEKTANNLQDRSKSISGSQSLKTTLTRIGKQKLSDLGYDGIVGKVMYANKGRDEFIAFLSTQFKNTTNLSPTSSADIRYSERDNEQITIDKSFNRSRDYLSPRDIITTAMETVAKTPGERKMLTAYKNTVGSLNALEREAALLRELNTQQRKLKADGDKTLIKNNVARIADIEAKIHQADMKLVKMQDAKPLKDLVTREGKIVHDKMMQEKRAAVAAMREAKNEIIARVKGEKKEAVADYRDKRNESAAVTKYRDRIMTATKDMLKWVASPDAKKGNYIPDVIAGDILPFLRAIDTSSKRALKGGADTQADIMFAKAFAELEQAIKRLNKKQNEGDERGGRFDFDNNLEFYLANIKAAIEGFGEGDTFVLNRMSAAQLEEFSKIVVGIRTAIKNWNKEYQVIGNNVISRTAESSMQGWSKFHKKLATNKTMQGVKKFLGWQNLQPIYAFERLGPDAVQLLKAARDGVDKTAFNIRDFVTFAEKAFKVEEVKAWESTFHTFEINGEQVQMPVAIMMDIYLESKREQALGHMFGVGARIDDFADGKKNIQDKRRIYTPQLVEQINSKLTDRQKEVADKIQQYVSTVGAKYGNEISQILYGYDKYTEDNYWPIKMDRDQKNIAEPDAGARGNTYALQNASHTFAVQPGANNGIVFRNIFDVAAQHMSDMIQYNAMVIPIQQMNKWLNYRQNIRDDSGTIIEQRNLREAMKQTYGEGATQYVQKLIEDMNSSRMISETDRLANRMLGRLNRSVIGWNLRVSLLQPMAYTKALTMLDAGAMTAAIAKNATGKLFKNMHELEANVGIAEWKQQGHFDLNASRSVSEMVKRNGTGFDKFQEAGMWLAGTMDRLTWSTLWEATKMTVTKRQGLKSGTDAHLKASVELFTEMTYKTQVVDNVLTRSEIMRDPSFTAKSFSSFKSEATQAYNMIVARVLMLRDDMASDMTKGQVWNKHKGALAKTFVAYTLTQAITALLESFMEAWRDDDEYATFLEKILENYMGNFTDNMLPVHIPFVDEMYSYLKRYLKFKGIIENYGFKPTSAITGPFDQFEALYKAVEQYNDNKHKGVKGYELYHPLSKALQLLSTITGVPFKNITGEPIDLWNNTFGQMYPKLKFYKYHGTRDGYDRLYKNELEGNTERVDEIKTVLKRNEETDKTILSAITAKAKEDYLEGKLTKEEVTALLNKQPESDANKTYWLIQKWDSEEEKYSDYNRFDEALVTGKDIQGAIKELVNNGYKDTTVRDRARETLKNAYKSGEISLSVATIRAEMYADYENLHLQMQKWEAEKSGNESFEYLEGFFNAVETGKDLRGAIKKYTDKGSYNKTKQALATAITNKYKDQYLGLLKTNRTEASRLKSRLLTAYTALGYSRSQMMKKINDWGT